MKLTWTVAWLIAWARSAPSGIDTALVVLPGSKIRLIMGDGQDGTVHLLPPRWRPWRYYGLLDAAARLLCEETMRIRRRVDAAHDEFCRGLDAREERGRS
jgi:hypothetical protein